MFDPCVPRICRPEKGLVVSVTVSRAAGQEENKLRYADIDRRGANYELIWTPREDETIRKCYRERLSCTAIAERLGRSVLAIRSRAKRLGVTRPVSRPWSKSDTNAIAAMWESNSPTAIGIEMHRSIDAVVGKANRLGLQQKKSSPRTGSWRGGSKGCG